MQSCPTCVHSEMQGPTLVCTKFNCRATPIASQDCTDYEREPGSDDHPLIWIAGGWHVAGEGRGD